MGCSSECGGDRAAHGTAHKNVMSHMSVLAKTCLPHHTPPLRHRPPDRPATKPSDRVQPPGPATGVPDGTGHELRSLFLNSHSPPCAFSVPSMTSHQGPVISLDVPVISRSRDTKSMKSRCRFGDFPSFRASFRASLRVLFPSSLPSPWPPTRRPIRSPAWRWHSTASLRHRLRPPLWCNLRRLLPTLMTRNTMPRHSWPQATQACRVAC